MEPKNLLSVLTGNCFLFLPSNDAGGEFSCLFGGKTLPA